MFHAVFSDAASQRSMEFIPSHEISAPFDLPRSSTPMKVQPVPGGQRPMEFPFADSQDVGKGIFRRNEIA